MSTPQSPNTNPGYIMRTDGKDCEYRLGVNAKGTVIVNGVDLGPVAELADLVELAAIGRLAVEHRRMSAVSAGMGKWYAKLTEMNLACDAHLAKKEAQR